MNFFKQLFKKNKDIKGKYQENNEIELVGGILMPLIEREIKSIVRIYKSDPNLAISTRFILRRLKRRKFRNPRKIVTNAIFENLLYVDMIGFSKDDWQDMKLALSIWGEQVWERLYG